MGSDDILAVDRNAKLAKASLFARNGDVRVAGELRRHTGSD